MSTLIKYASAVITVLLVALQSTFAIAQNNEPPTPPPASIDDHAPSPDTAQKPIAAPPSEVPARVAADVPEPAHPTSALDAPRADAKPASTSSIQLGLLPPPSPLKLEGANGTIRFGLLAQPQFQEVGSPTLDGLTKDVYLRRIRFMVGGTLLKYFEYFWQVDSPNLFRTQSTTANMTTVTQKGNQGVNLVDAFGTFKPVDDYFKVDAGYFLPPLAHNYIQGAGTLFGWDFFANTYRASGVFGSAGADPAGRDLGVQLRGLLLGQHVEYRAGVFQGVRDTQVSATTDNPGRVGGRNTLRVAARLQLNFLDADPAMYYSGTYLGSKKVVSVGGAYDAQGSYRYWAIDAIVDVPAGPGIVSAQMNLVGWDGGALIPALPKQHALMAEAGYIIKPVLLSPILRYEDREMSSGPTSAAPNEKRYAVGLAFWPYGHSVNLKMFYSRIHQEPSTHDYDQFNAQWQLFFY